MTHELLDDRPAAGLIIAGVGLTGQAPPAARTAADGARALRDRDGRPRARRPSTAARRDLYGGW